MPSLATLFASTCCGIKGRAGKRANRWGTELRHRMMFPSQGAQTLNAASFCGKDIVHTECAVHYVRTHVSYKNTNTPVQMPIIFIGIERGRLSGKVTREETYQRN